MYLRQEDGVDIRIVLEPLQHPHPLNLPRATVDIRLPEFLGVRLGYLSTRTRKDVKLTSSAKTLSEKTITLSPLASWNLMRN
jgi:hypothetical protein